MKNETDIDLTDPFFQPAIRLALVRFLRRYHGRKLTLTLVASELKISRPTMYKLLQEV